MGKYGKYTKKYNPDWEKEPQFKGWLQATPPAVLAAGDPFKTAYCKLCRCGLRPHKTDLGDHSQSKKHKLAAEAAPCTSRSQTKLTNFGFKAPSKTSKQVDLKLAALVACHTSIKTVDHLGEVIKDIGKDTPLSELKLHRTKCSRLIENVLAPSILEEIVEDVGDSWFSIIVDESTDNTTVKHLAVTAQYFSFRKTKKMSVFLGLIETPICTAEILYQAVKEFLLKLGLTLDKLFAIGTDGALNLCGAHNSLYALLKKNDCPNLHLVKCVCHGLDKCANYASKAMPPSLEVLIRESRNWFSNSAKRKWEYENLYKSLTDGSKPPTLVSLGATRWLSWYKAVKVHCEQYNALHKLFRQAAEADPNNKCPIAHMLADMHEDKAHLLYLTFLRPILREAASMNTVFQCSVADVSRVYTDLREFIFALARRVVKPEALVQGQHGMLRLTELQVLKTTLQNRANFKPLELVGYGEHFWQTAAEVKLSDDSLRAVQTRCADFLVKYINELTARLPSCMDAVEKLRAFSPSTVLRTRARPEFRDLPLNLLNDATMDREAIESQWLRLGSLSLADIDPEFSSVESINILDFWAAVWKIKNAAGCRIFKEIAEYVLNVLSLPLSNAVVERLFSILGVVKTKLRNKLSLNMLQALLLIRTYFQANEMCCREFQPTETMLEKFNVSMYNSNKKMTGTGAADDDNDETAVDDPPEVHIENVDINDAWEHAFALLEELENDI